MVGEFMSEEEQIAAVLGAFVGAFLAIGPIFTWLMINN
jgi:hypothetical protein